MNREFMLRRIWDMLRNAEDKTVRRAYLYITGLLTK